MRDADRREERSEEKSVHVGSVVIECNELPAMLAFWQEALGYLLHPR